MKYPYTWIGMIPFLKLNSPSVCWAAHDLKSVIGHDLRRTAEQFRDLGFDLSPGAKDLVDYISSSPSAFSDKFIAGYHNALAAIKDQCSEFYRESRNIVQFSFALDVETYAIESDYEEIEMAPAFSLDPPIDNKPFYNGPLWDNILIVTDEAYQLDSDIEYAWSAVPFFLHGGKLHINESVFTFMVDNDLTIPMIQYLFTYQQLWLSMVGTEAYLDFLIKEEEYLEVEDMEDIHFTISACAREIIFKHFLNQDIWRDNYDYAGPALWEKMVYSTVCTVYGIKTERPNTCQVEDFLALLIHCQYHYDPTRTSWDIEELFSRFFKAENGYGSELLGELNVVDDLEKKLGTAFESMFVKLDQYVLGRRPDCGTG